MIQRWGIWPGSTSPSGKLPSSASDSSHLGHRTDQTEDSLLLHCLHKIILLSPTCLAGLTARHREALAWLRLKQVPWGEHFQSWTETQPTLTESERRSWLSRSLLGIQGCMHVEKEWSKHIIVLWSRACLKSKGHCCKLSLKPKFCA